jgi:hypothetical protein
VAAKSQTKDIAGIKVTAHQLAPLRAYALSVRVGKLLVALLGQVNFDDLRRGEVDGPTMLAVLDALQGDERLVPDLLAACSAVVNGENTDLDDEAAVNRAFAGKLGAMLKAALFAAQVNFADFFDDVFSARQGAAAALETVAGMPAQEKPAA